MVAVMDDGFTRLRPRTLTPREREILDLLLEARSDREIAMRMEISVQTVRFHLSNLFRKFQVHSRNQLTVKCFQSKLAAS